MSKTLVQIQVDEKRFRAHQVIDRLALDIRAGEVVIIVGPPGAAAEIDDAALDAALVPALAAQPLKLAVAEVVDRLGLPRNRVYARALALRDARR